jgi:hypothetical protein
MVVARDSKIANSIAFSILIFVFGLAAIIIIWQYVQLLEE